MKSTHDQSATNSAHPTTGHLQQRLHYDSPSEVLSGLGRAHQHQLAYPAAVPSADHHHLHHHHHPPYYTQNDQLLLHHLHHHPNLLPAAAAVSQRAPAGCRRSLSGSETDISTSTENLTHEEKYVLRNSTRQEPQGEETLDLEDSGGGGGPPVPPYRGGSWISATTGLGSSYASMDQSSCKTLIIHGMDHDDDFTDNGAGSGCEDFGDVDDDDEAPTHCDGGRRTPSRHHRHRSRGRDDAALRQAPTRTAPPHYCQQQYGPVQPPPHYASSSGASSQMLPQEITDIPRHYLDQSEVLKHLLAKEMQAGLDAAMLMPYSSHHVPQYVHQAFFGTDFDLSQLPPPPEYPGRVASSSGNAPTLSSAVSKMSLASPSSETTDGSTTATSPSDSSPGFPVAARRVSAPAASASLLSRSQPDLSRWGGGEDGCVGLSRCSGHFSPRPRTKGKASPDVPPSLLHQRAHSVKYGLGCSVDGGGDAGVTFEKLNRALLLENRQLKADLDIFTTKVSRLQKFEVDIQKVHHAYEELVKSSQKRETLNQAVRGKLELEVRRLHDVSKELKDQLESMNGNVRFQRRPTSEDNSDSGKQELQCRDQFIAQLIQQNKELTAAKERHEIELAAQRATLQEQRTHIDILDSALTNAQANVVRLEEECRKKGAHAERVAQLQRALTALQVASERREQMERKLRNQLERDLNELRQRHLVQRSAVAARRGQQQARSADSTSTGDLHVESGGGVGAAASSSSSGKGGSSRGSEEAAECSERAVDDLKSALRGKEERIMALETSLSKWEQRYLEENAMRQMAIDAASMPKDAKIAALERTSQESEKLIAEARTDKLRHMDELHLANRRCTDLESKARDLESRLAERDAMIRVLQQHSIDRDAAFHSAMLRSPRHTPHSSLIHPSAATASARGAGLYAAGTVTSGGDDAVVPASSSSSSREEHLPSSAASGDVSETSAASGSALDAAATQESLDEQLKKLDSQLLSKDSIINALRSEKEKYPSHYWMV